MRSLFRVLTITSTGGIANPAPKIAYVVPDIREHVRSAEATANDELHARNTVRRSLTSSYT